MIGVFDGLPHLAGTEYPEPQLGDLWIIEDPFWKAKKVEAARAAQVSALLVGTNTALRAEAEFLGVTVLLDKDLDPDEILRWVQEKQKERPALRKTQKRGIIVAFAGLLPTGGGVGKDTLAINTAAWLSVHGKTVAIVDLDPFGTLKKRLKAETPLSVDVWEERFMNSALTSDLVKNTLIRTKLKFWLLPASTARRIQTDATIRHMGQWLSLAFDVVIWNLGSGPAGKSFFAALHQVDHVFLVGTGDRAKFELFQETLEDYGVMLDVAPKIIFNKFYDKDAPAFFEDEFGHPVFAYALEDRRVFELNEQGKAVALEQPRRPFGLAVQKIGREILGKAEEENPKKGGFWPW